MNTLESKTVTRGLITLASIFVGILIGPARVWSADAVSGVQTYQATYDASYKGRRVGRSEFSVTHDATTGVYQFDSTSRFRGLYRLIAPRPIVERSDFTYQDGQIRPLEYQYEDGTRKGEDSYQIVFDWERRIATTTASGGSMESTLIPGLLDRGSMQVAVMLRMHGSNRPSSYQLLDEEGIRIYEYSADGEESLDTPVGAVATQKFIQQRQGSSRRTFLWIAEQLRYVPVRIEQQQNGETRAAFDLTSIEWLENPE